ncbi:hypothetical protein [Duganella fentianensis]|uniref:hypothetical protein n=1 Tax=Duganella fentianensis TaxID=2692177 RepID=UPI0032B1CF05
MPARKPKLVTVPPLSPLPPVPPALRSCQTLPAMLEPLLRVGKERVIFSAQQDECWAFLPALIEPDS